MHTSSPHLLERLDSLLGGADLRRSLQVGKLEPLRRCLLEVRVVE
jgi:hypothetical protein